MSYLSLTHILTNNGSGLIVETGISRAPENVYVWIVADSEKKK